MDVGGDFSAYRRTDSFWSDLPSVSDSGAEMAPKQRVQALAIDPHRQKEAPPRPMTRQPCGLVLMRASPQVQV